VKESAESAQVNVSGMSHAGTLGNFPAHVMKRMAVNILAYRPSFPERC